MSHLFVTLEAMKYDPERFWSFVDRSGDCWLWLAYRSKDGYGRVWFDGKRKGAHRVAYELAIGPIPDGLELDHLCRNPGCVNPAHLEAVTHKVNVHRGETIAAHNAQKSHCVKGHEFSEANTYRVGTRGWRACRNCHLEHMRRWYANKCQADA